MILEPRAGQDPSCLGGGAAVRLRQASWIATAALVLITFLLFVQTDTALVTDEVGVALLPLAILVGAAMIARRRLQNGSRLADLAEGLTLLLLASLAGAAASLLVLRWGMPQADPMLLAGDSMIMVDTAALIG